MRDSICPLIAIAASVENANSALCLSDRCAWWDCLENGCCLRAIAASIQGLQEIVGMLEVAGKRPVSGEELTCE